MCGPFTAMGGRTTSVRAMALRAPGDVTKSNTFSGDVGRALMRRPRWRPRSPAHALIGRIAAPEPFPACARGLTAGRRIGQCGEPAEYRHSPQSRSLHAISPRQVGGACRAPSEGWRREVSRASHRPPSGGTVSCIAPIARGAGYGQGARRRRSLTRRRVAPDSAANPYGPSFVAGFRISRNVISGEPRLARRGVPKALRRQWQRIDVRPIRTVTWRRHHEGRRLQTVN